MNKEEYNREFHTSGNIYSIEICYQTLFVRLKLGDETLQSDTFEYFATHSDFLKQYENGLVYRWIKRVLCSIELDRKCVDDWTYFPE